MGLRRLLNFYQGRVEKRETEKQKINKKKKAKYSLVHIKITAGVTKSLHQDFDHCYLHFPNFSFTYALK